MKTAIDESLKRVDDAEKSNKRKILDLLQKKKDQDEKGNVLFMRKNKKNYGDQSQWKSIVSNRKYEIYKTENDHRRQYQSTQKVRLKPLGDGSRSKRGLEKD